jgi:GPH family glycoside/pentoside/hexuronide:cation symporter
MTNVRLDTKQRVFYALASFGGGIPHFVLLIYFLKYATDVLRLDAALVATIFAGVRIWDAISDVIVGTLSDTTRTRWGRRRPWIALGAVGLALAIPLLWIPPTLDSHLLAVWIAVALAVYFTAHTAVYVPYGALGVELTNGLDDRSRLFTYRHVAYIFAMVAGIGVVAAFTELDAPRLVGAWVGAGGALIAIVSVLPLCIAIREPTTDHTLPSRSLTKMLSALAADEQARHLYGIAFVQRMGGAAVSALGPFVTAVLIGNESALPLLLGTYVATGLVFAPMIVPMARRIGTARLWRGAMFLAAMGFTGLGFVQRGALFQVVLCAVVIGAAHSCAAVLDRTLLADAIDRAEARTGMRDEALYVSIATFVDKTAFGLAVFVTGLGLSWAHYTPDVADQPDVAIALRIMIAGLPVAGYVAGLAISFRVRLAESEPASVRNDRF